jgi:hypothetical protein
MAAASVFLLALLVSSGELGEGHAQLRTDSGPPGSQH